MKKQSNKIKQSLLEKISKPVAFSIAGVALFVGLSLVLFRDGSGLGVSNADAAVVNPITGLKFGPLGNESASYLRDIDPVIKSWSTTRPTDASILKKVYSRPVADWYAEDWVSTANISTKINEVVTKQKSKGRTPVFVMYSIPKRDCGYYSAGGSTTTSYLPWVTEFAKGLNGRKSVVLLEPDGVALAGCLNATDYQTRMSLLSQAVTILKAQGAVVYLDAGGPRWPGADVITPRLNDAGIKNADGFMLNVANFYTTTENNTFGKMLSDRLNGKHYVIDVSRNGNGPYMYNGTTNQWCNPPGRALGRTPDAQSSSSRVDAYLWIKTPGRSDGVCTEFGQNDPKAGTFMPEYILGLAKNAGY